jgi:hypothetical protein
MISYGGKPDPKERFKGRKREVKDLMWRLSLYTPEFARASAEAFDGL